ncbi:MAG: D-alanyl-D-alanine carboxypeptidase/D-alanyl-D-alanine-endopeptidase [Deltaproteobacteria bacterium]|nr:D-alanyl-D-alanine carboxypeptidase/D-alanyl-D-alanine-endopeptidase [Deltaproteobacteria bacterium]
MFAAPIALFIALTAIGRGPAPAPPEARAQAAVDELLASPALGGGRKGDAGLEVGVAVRCTTDDASWGLAQADAVLNPASGTKLLTTAAALTRLPADTRWATTVHGELASGEVQGDLVLVGGGDPWLEVADLERLAKALGAAGVRRVRGDVVADVSRFEPPALPPAYDQKKADAAYRPAVPALGVAFGATMVSVRPGKAVGDPVRVSTTPAASSIVIESSATTVAGKAQNLLVVESKPGAEGRTRVVVSGSLGIKAPAQGVRKRVEDPARVALDLFRAALKKQRIEVAGAPEISVQPVARGPELARVESRGLAEIVREINTFSNNFMAETLFAHLGEDASGRASWSRAARAVTTTLVELGLPAGAFRIVNGSGLYDATHVSASAMVLLLDLMAGKAPFVDSLAIAGQTGTLRNRLKRVAGKVSGKTGTLDDAMSLSGYVTAKSGCPLAFAVIVNGPIGDEAGKVQGAVDRFVMALTGL